MPKSPFYHLLRSKLEQFEPQKITKIAKRILPAKNVQTLECADAGFLDNDANKEERVVHNE